MRQEQSRTGEMDKAGEKGGTCVGLVSEELRGMDLDTKSKAWTREERCSPTFGRYAGGRKTRGLLSTASSMTMKSEWKSPMGWRLGVADGRGGNGTEQTERGKLRLSEKCNREVGSVWGPFEMWSKL